jgi:hypothetical protein
LDWHRVGPDGKLMSIDIKDVLIGSRVDILSNRGSPLWLRGTVIEIEQRGPNIIHTTVQLDNPSKSPFVDPSVRWQMGHGYEDTRLLDALELLAEI